MTPIETLLENNRNRRLRIAVAGDGIVDTWIEGTVERVSPEAPTPVLSVKPAGATFLPGGAYNVAWQLRPWNVEILLHCFTAPNIASILPVCGLDDSRCVRLKQGRIPIKQRFCTSRQVLLRTDEEWPEFNEGPGLVDLREELLTSIKVSIREGIDCLILSDYLKGTFTDGMLRQLLALCKKANVKVVVDPKRRMKWSGTTAVKMTEREFADIMESLASTGPMTGVSFVVTRSAEPPVVYDGCESTTVVPPHPDRPFPINVSGAGDHFTALLGLGLAHGLHVYDAASIAHESGRCYVQRRHNAAVLPHELHARFDCTGSKLRTAPEVAFALSWRQPGRIVFTNGVFDLPHRGHTAFLEWARRQGDVLVVGVNSDASASRLKGLGRPVIPDWQRASILAGLSCVDFVILFDEDTPEDLMKLLGPAILVKGPEFLGKEDMLPGAGLVQNVLIAPANKASHHARDIIEKIEKLGTQNKRAQSCTSSPVRNAGP